MGAELSSVAPSMILSAEKHLADLPDYAFLRSLGSTRFMKVAMAYRHRNQTQPCVLKIFSLGTTASDAESKKSTEYYMLRDQRQKVQAVSTSLQSNGLNCLPFIETYLCEREAILVRPYAQNTLYDRLSTRPFLSLVEKRWIAYQLLRALEQCAQAGVWHGDIKTENVLISSTGWVQITDFASYKPIFVPHDNPSTYSYFFDTSRRRVCYLAPERFRSGGPAGGPIDLSGFDYHAMDIFSVGCVVLEILADGVPTFTLSQMLSFCSDPATSTTHVRAHLDKIPCTHLRALLEDMLQHDAGQRPLIVKALAHDAFPSEFVQFLFPYLAEFLKQPLLSPDARVTKLVLDFDTIILPRLAKQLDLLLLILPYVTSVYRALHNSKTRVESLTLMQRIVHCLPDDLNKSTVFLDRVLPYLCHALRDDFSQVRVHAINVMAECFTNVQRIQAYEVHVLSEYVLPRLHRIVNDKSTSVRMAFAHNLHRIAAASARMQPVAKKNSAAHHKEEDANTEKYIDEERKIVHSAIQDLVVALLCDSSNAVKRALVSDGRLAPLAQFFGRSAAADVLLSHTITFLNDKTDWSLRSAFFECIPVLANQIGCHCTPVLKPLLLQGLRDPEENVVCNALRCIADLVKDSVLEKQCIYDILSDCVAFLCHPNAWICFAACSLVCVVCKWLSLADVHCKIIPLTRPYLKHDLIQMERSDVLSHALVPPIGRDLYEMVSGLSSPKVLEQLFVHLEGRQFARKLGGSHPEPQEKSQLAVVINRLQARGLTPSVEDRLLAFRDIVKKMHSIRFSVEPKSPHSSGIGSVNISDYVPRERCYQHSLLNVTTGATTSLPPARKPTAPTLASDLDARVNEEWQDMFGVVAVPVTPLEEKQEALYPERGETVSPASSGVTLLPDVEQMIQSATQEATGNVHSQCMVNLTETLQYKRSLVSAAINPPMSSNNVSPKPWRPVGQHLAHLHEHRLAVNQLAAHPNGFLFASVSADGWLRVWDAQRIERSRSMVNKSRAAHQCYADRSKQSVTCVGFLDDGNTLAYSGDACTVSLLRMDDKCKLSPSTSYSLDAQTHGRAICMQTVPSTNRNLVYVSTHHGHVLCYDIRQPEPVFDLRNEDKYGLVTSFCATRDWGCLGTDSGYMVVYDFRFRLPINTLNHPAYRCITRLWPYPEHQSRVLAAVEGNSEVSLWDLETTARTFALWPSEKPLLAYSQTELDHRSQRSACFLDRSQLLTGDQLGQVHLWNLTHLDRSAMLSTSAIGRQYVYRSAVVEGIEVISESSHRHQQGSAASSGPELPSTAHCDAINDIVALPAVGYFATAGADGAIKIWK